MGAEKLLLFMWNKIRDPSAHFVRSGCQGDGVVCSWCQGEWGCSLRIPICGAMASEVYLQIFLLVCYSKIWHVERNVSIDTWSRNILGFVFVILTPKNLLVFNFCKEILRLTSFAKDARGVGLFAHDAGECFFSLRVSWPKAFR